MNFQIKSNITNATAAMERRLKDQLPYATSVAINKTAMAIKESEKKEMEIVFDRPTRFTLNSIYLSLSTKYRVFAEIGIKDQNNQKNHYLLPQIKGGGRILKPYEAVLNRFKYLPNGMYTVPAKGARIDAHGNMSQGQIVQILSYLGAAESWAGYMMNVTKRSKKLNRKPREYFIMKNSMNRPVGIYQRVPGDKFPMPVLIFVNQPNYKNRFDFYGVAKKNAKRIFPEEFKQAYKNSMRTAR